MPNIFSFLGKYSNKISYAFKRLIFLGFLSILIFSFQNCSPSFLKSVPFSSTLQKDGGNGEPYDGKPEGYTRLAPGPMCADKTVPYGSLDIVGDFAAVISNENRCANISEQVPVKNLEFSSFSDLYIGYKDGVYTYLKDRGENIRKEIFTEAWCKALKPNSKESVAEFVVEWQAAGKMARFAILNQKDLAPQFVSTERRIDLDRVSYTTSDKKLLSINFRQRSAVTSKFSGKYLGELNGHLTELTVDCLMGGQFDPTAPQFDFAGSSDQTLAVDETMTPLVPEVNISTTTFKISNSLPNGIRFDTTTGMISGAPSELAAQKEFWVTAQFPFGEVTRRISIGVGQVQLVDQTFVNAAALACVDPIKNCDLRGALAKSKLISPIPLIVRLQVPTIDFKGQELQVTDYISVQGLPTKTTLDAHSLSRHFSVASSVAQLGNTSTFAHLELVNLKLINGNAPMGGSVYSNYGSVTIRNSSFVNNAALSGNFVSGGALGLMKSTLSITDSKFIGNRSPDASFGSGGAIDMMWPFWGSIKNTDFKNNSTFNFGGAVNITHKTFSAIEFTNCLFESNSATRIGGAISSQEVDLFISKSRFVANTAGDAAAIRVYFAKRIWILDSLVSDNTSAASILRFDGGTWNAGNEIGTSIAYIMNSQFLENQTPNGTGAVFQAANMKNIFINSVFNSHGKSTECMSMDSPQTSTAPNALFLYEPTNSSRWAGRRLMVLVPVTKMAGIW